jgi:DNA-binding response OmpR family regulator
VAIAWITTRPEPCEIEIFPTSQWEFNVFRPAEFVSTYLSWPGNLDVIVIEVMDRPLLDTCREICHARIAPVFGIVADLAYAQAVLEDGADDFLLVPVNPIEALLRVRKLTRSAKIVRVVDLEIDLLAWNVNYCGQRVHLSTLEFRLLASLAKRVGQMVDHATLLEEVWKLKIELKPLAHVTSYIGCVRKKIEPDPQNPQYIISIPGTGYRLRNHRQWREAQRDIENAPLLS